jgi:SAM-dependent methyltransferase
VTAVTIGNGGDYARRADALYDRDYARRYRARDGALQSDPAYEAIVGRLRAVCQAFAQPITVLDLGCGTGRHFRALARVSRLVGLDASQAMLAEARAPIAADEIDVGARLLVRGDLQTSEFAPASFDLVYSIGVLAEHVPLDAALIARIARWLRPGGRFAFTTVHPASASIRKTVQRRLASALLPLLPSGASRTLHTRLMGHGHYGDERWVRARMNGTFEIDVLERFESDVHLHLWCVARRVIR